MQLGQVGIVNLLQRRYPSYTHFTDLVGGWVEGMRADRQTKLDCCVGDAKGSVINRL